MNALVEIVEIAREVSTHQGMTDVMREILEKRGIDTILLDVSDNEWDRVKSENLIRFYHEPTRRAS